MGCFYSPLLVSLVKEGVLFMKNEELKIL